LNEHDDDFVVLLGKETAGGFRRAQCEPDTEASVNSGMKPLNDERVKAVLFSKKRNKAYKIKSLKYRRRTGDNVLSHASDKEYFRRFGRWCQDAIQSGEDRGLSRQHAGAEMEQALDEAGNLLVRSQAGGFVREFRDRRELARENAQLKSQLEAMQQELDRARAHIAGEGSSSEL
jgi:hypothetical protein